ncbi:putative dimethylaniline monooxygenase [Acephala macrosclerotiorum]|nr:putative dimethylaniline monooxygenase [Acephala macrosclerotiorum]
MISNYDIVIVGARLSRINAAQRVQTGFPGPTYTILEAREALAIADGPSIKKYLVKSAAESGIEKHIQYHHRLVSADWSSKTQAWSLIVDADGEKRYTKIGFMVYGTGYYDYDEPLQTTIPNIDKFQGTLVHPQFWYQDLDYSNKKIDIIGSGATAVTLLPALAKTTASATTDKELPQHIAQNPHFKPAYNPWEQRLCVCPDGDFYHALRQGNSHVVMDTIETVTESGIRTSAGTILDADIIVTATGLRMKFAGGIRASVDGTVIKFSDKYLWKGALMQDVPNTAFLLGYTNASWTLGAEASMQLVCRILRYMMARRFKTRPTNMINLKSTYIISGQSILPKGGDVGRWKARVNYFKGFCHAKFGGMEGLEFGGAF